MSRAPSPQSLSPRCSVCNRVAAEIEIDEISPGEWHFKYRGPGGSNGSGDHIGAERANAIQEAFADEPYAGEKIKKAWLCDDAGFCMDCAEFYCPAHWNISSSGGGQCPQGHFKSLDPHWSPEQDDEDDQQAH